MCHCDSDLESINSRCSSTSVPLLLHKRARKRNCKRTMEVGTHGYTYPHSGRHPGVADRNNRFRPAGTQLGSDVKAVETSALTGLIRDELETCTVKGLGNATERYHLARRLVQWDLLKQNGYQGSKRGGGEVMIGAHALDFFTQSSRRRAESTLTCHLKMSDSFWSSCCTWRHTESCGFSTDAERESAALPFVHYSLITSVFTSLSLQFLACAASHCFLQSCKYTLEA